MAYVLLVIVGVNQDVVDVHDYPSVQHVAEDVIHECLED